MQSSRNYNPWYFLPDFKGTEFNGEWPTLPELFNITTKRYPDNACFTDFEGPDGSRNSLTYSQSRDKILALANFLASSGLKHGDKVAVTGKNSPEWAVTYLAVLYAGGIVCPLDYALHEKELDNLIKTAEPKFLFVDSEKYTYFTQESPVVKSLGSKVFSLSPKHRDEYVYNLKASQKAEIIPATEDETAAILFTSGTTGEPKGVMLSHKNLVSDCFIAQKNMIIYSTDVFYALLPIHHAYTMLAVFIETISVGSEVVFGKSLAVSHMLKELEEGHITMLLGVPLLFNKLASGILKGIKEKGPLVYGLMKFLMGLSYGIKKVFRINPGKHLFKSVLKSAHLSTVRIAICGGGPLAPSVFKFFNEMGIDFVQGYGLTETSPIIALNPIEHFKIESVGQYFIDNMQMKILNPNEDGIGEIAVKGSMVMQGYYKMPDETAKMFTEDGWFKTGDLGWLDKEGYLMLAGRAKNMIVTEGGKNVYPEEIEDAFQLEDAVAQIMVRGYVANKDTRSEELEALIYPSDDALSRLNVTREASAGDETVRKDIEAVVSRINKTLQPYQRITKVTILEKPLEMTTTQKIKRG